MGLDLREYRKPLEAVTFPNGAEHMPTLFGPAEYQLWRDMLTETDGVQRVALCVQIIVACYPTVTNADLLDCNAEMLIDLAAYPGGKIEWVRAMLKNADAVAETAGATPPKPEAPTTPSSPKTSGSTSSRSTRKRSAKTGGPSTTTSDPTTSGSPSTTSQSLGESTPYAVNWKTSTAPVSPASQ